MQPTQRFLFGAYDKWENGYTGAANAYNTTIGFSEGNDGSTIITEANFGAYYSGLIAKMAEYGMNCLLGQAVDAANTALPDFEQRWRFMQTSLLPNTGVGLMLSLVNPAAGQRELPGFVVNGIPKPQQFDAVYNGGLVGLKFKDEPADEGDLRDYRSKAIFIQRGIADGQIPPLPVYTAMVGENYGRALADKAALELLNTVDADAAVPQDYIDTFWTQTVDPASGLALPKIRRFVRLYPFRGSYAGAVTYNAGLLPADDLTFDGTNYNRVPQPGEYAVAKMAAHPAKLFENIESFDPGGDWVYIPQAFGRFNDFWRLPTEAEMEAHCHLALANGARGLMFYSMQDHKFNNTDYILRGLFSQDLTVANAAADGSIPAEAVKRLARAVARSEDILLTHRPAASNVTISDAEVYLRPRNAGQRRGWYCVNRNCDTAKTVTLSLPVRVSHVEDVLSGEMYRRDESIPFRKGQGRFLMEANNPAPSRGAIGGI